MTNWEWPKSTLVRVIDGDTLDFVVVRDVGFGITTHLPIRIRLNRIDAPAIATAQGKAAKARVVELLEQSSNIVDVVTIKSYKYGPPEDDAVDQMAEVVLADGRNVSDVLMAEGLAVYWDGKGPRPSKLAKE